MNLSYVNKRKKYLCNFFKKSYWGIKSKQRKEENENELEFDEIKKDEVGFEADPSGLNTAISIEKITKVII